MDKEKPKPPLDKPLSEKASERAEDLVPNPAVDDFFSRMNYDMRRPKPAQEAVSAALQAIQRLGAQTDSEDSLKAEDAEDSYETRMCHACGNLNPLGNKFCATCGVPLRTAAPERSEIPTTSDPKKPGEAASPHYYHHHYHHHYFVTEGAPGPTPQQGQSRDTAAPARDAGRARVPAPLPLAGSALSRAEVAVRKVTQDWALACNTTHLDDLVELYTADALVLRPNVSPLRGSASIREFLFSVLDAGLGEVELEPLRVELFGDVAWEAGRCKMLVPTATGKRREERGKYLVVLTRQAGEWKILVDSWSSDLSLGATGEAPLKADQVPGSAGARTPRKI
jgi:uncharacterized protein (TIGR02246 family)